jgi:large subunit ribosomal protein L25
MRRDITVVAEPRESRGKNEARRLRARKMVPGVLYGAYKNSVPLSLNPKDLLAVLRTSSGQNTIFNLSVNGIESTPAMLVDIQHEPVRGAILHADLKRIDLEKRIRVSIPVAIVNDTTAIGVKVQGGQMEVVTREVEIECLPDEIPEKFTADVANLHIGESVRASALTLSGSMKLTSSPDTVIVHVVGTRTTEEAAPAAEGAATTAAEPEVIKKGKKEEEGAAPAADKKKK